VYLITGSTGMAGIGVLEYLVSIGYTKKVKCIVRSSSDLSKHDHITLPIEYIVCDLDCVVDFEGKLNDDYISRFTSAFNEIDVIIHLASIRYSKPMIEVAKKFHIERIILVHTVLMYSKYYKYAKYYQRIEGEILVNSDINFTILRPTILYGNEYDQLIHPIFQKLLNKKVYIIAGNYDVYYQPTHVDDLVQAVFDVIDNESCYKASFILSGPTPYRFIDIVKMIRKIMKTKNVIFRIPSYMINFVMCLDALLHGDKMPSYKENMHKLEDRQYAHGKATDYFGYEPISLYEGLTKEYDRLNVWLNQ